jgi:hypothetical protein
MNFRFQLGKKREKEICLERTRPVVNVRRAHSERSYIDYIQYGRVHYKRLSDLAKTSGEADLA